MEKSDRRPSAAKRKPVLYGLAGLFVLVLLYFSFDVIPLEDHQKEASGADLTEEVESYFVETLPAAIAEAPELCALMASLETEDGTGWEQYGRQSTIGNRYYFLLRGQGKVTAIEDDYLTIAFEAGEARCTARISTVYIFGNEIRDASGKLPLAEVGDLSTFNRLSELINTHVREEVVTPFLKEVAVGKTVQVAGAFALNRRLGLDANMEIKPIQLQLINE